MNQTDNPANSWQRPPQNLTLPQDELHVWRVRMDDYAAMQDRLNGLLSPDEQARAARFFFERDRDMFLVVHGLLRVLLGRYLNQAPDQMHFSYGPQGKPGLDPVHHPQGLGFNLSHVGGAADQTGGGLALLAFVRDRQLGIDLEKVRSGFPVDQVSEHFLAPSEVEALNSLPPARRESFFFTCWTRKEAFVKAMGEGLTMPLNQFAVSAVPGQAPLLLSVQEDPRQAARWHLQDIPVPPGYAATVAIENPAPELRLWEDRHLEF